MIRARPETAERLRIACMHRSWVNETQDTSVALQQEANERLEFLGDSVLGLIIAKILYQRLPQHNEGRLSKAKARLVSSRVLADFAKTIDLGSALLLGHGEEISGGRERISLLADALEAVIGAIFLAEGFKAAEDFVLTLWKDEIEVEIAGLNSDDYKSLLQEHLQKQTGVLPVYTVEKSIGPDHNRQYEVSVAIDGKICGRGWGKSKKQAAQAAAAEAYHILKKEILITGEDT